MTKPFLKWAGGKTQLLKNIRELYPENIETYFEPFIGGGAVFFDLAPKKYLLSDSNPELINAYKVVATKPKELIQELKKMKNTSEFFYQLRSLKYEDLNKISAAARTIFLNRTCFNGLYRVNKSGHFNVPYGKYKNPDYIQEDRVLSCSRMLKSKNLKCMDFRKLKNTSFKKNDFIFFDPPYVPLDGYSDFKRYTKEQFYEDSQRDLAEIFKALAKKGVRLVLTNSNTVLIDELYDGFDKIIIDSKRNISSKGSTRKSQDVIIHANI